MRVASWVAAVPSSVTWTPAARAGAGSTATTRDAAAVTDRAGVPPRSPAVRRHRLLLGHP
ncbi:MAG: hypothetical protein R2734_17020 [Nocardioides sp.]